MNRIAELRRSVGIVALGLMAATAARVEIFRDAGHALFVNEPARFNALLESFMEDL